MHAWSAVSASAGGRRRQTVHLVQHQLQVAAVILHQQRTVGRLTALQHQPVSVHLELVQVLRLRPAGRLQDLPG